MVQWEWQDHLAPMALKDPQDLQDFQDHLVSQVFQVPQLVLQDVTAPWDLQGLLDIKYVCRRVI